MRTGFRNLLYWFSSVWTLYSIKGKSAAVYSVINSIAPYKLKKCYWFRISSYPLLLTLGSADISHIANRRWGNAGTPEYKSTLKSLGCRFLDCW